MATSRPAPAKWQLRVRALLVLGYLVIVALGPTTDIQPRLFWTVLLPLLPISIVLMGFANWRRLCPLAFFGELGARINRGAQRRVPGWLERWFLPVTFSGLLLMLVLRLVATNGDGTWLAALLVGLALLALATNALFTGKSWCNFFCPVSLVERIYTEPRSLPRTPNSQCVRCTACKRSCPDIDPENAYWRDLGSPGRRAATYAFPGLVLAFYTYYWLRHGDWEAYFDGRWTQLPVGSDLVFGAGLFFAPRIPALLAALLTLVVFSLVSLVLFAGLEKIAAKVVEHTERRRHLTLSLAAFAAFSIFYVFAGAPSLRQVPGAARVMAFSAPLLATLMLLKRWGRTRELFIREKGAAKLLKNWTFDEPPPEDPREVYGWIKAGEHARERSVEAYANTVREMIADGLLHRGEMRLLEGVRKQLGVSEREHQKVLERLTEEERHLFEGEHPPGVEERLQLEGYEAALAEGLLRHASEPELVELRRAFGIDPATHDRLLERMRGASGLLLDRARVQVGRLRALHEDVAAVDVTDATEAELFLSYLLERDRDDALGRVMELLEIVGPSDPVRALRDRVLGRDAATRRAALDQLARVCEGASGLIEELAPWVGERDSAVSARDPVRWVDTLQRLSETADPYVRAGAAWAATASDDPKALAIVERARSDDHPLVRETTAGLPAGGEAEASFSRRTTLPKMQFLRGVRMFENLDPEDLRDLTGFVTEEIVAPPQLLCEEGGVDEDDLFILLEGEASVVVRGEDREDSGDPAVEREVARLDPGEIFGEMSMLDGSARSATVRPDGGPVRVLRVSGRRFKERLLSRSRVARPLLAMLSQRIRRLSRRVAQD